MNSSGRRRGGSHQARHQLAKKRVRKNLEFLQAEMRRGEKEEVRFGEVHYDAVVGLSEADFYHVFARPVRNLRKLIRVNDDRQLIPSYLGIALATARDKECVLGPKFMGLLTTIAIREYIKDRLRWRHLTDPLTDELAIGSVEPAWHDASRSRNPENRIAWTELVSFIGALVPFRETEQQIFQTAIRMQLFVGDQFDNQEIGTELRLAPQVVSRHVANYKRRFARFCEANDLNQVPLIRWLYGQIAVKRTTPDKCSRGFAASCKR